MYQAMAQLLAANIHTQVHQPAPVCTDLCDEWHILWMDGNQVWVYTPVTRFEAVAIVEDVLCAPAPSELGSGSVASSHADNEGISRVLKRRRFKQM